MSFEVRSPSGYRLTSSPPLRRAYGNGRVPEHPSKLAEKAAVTAGAQPVLLIDRLQRAAEFRLTEGRRPAF